MDEESSGGDKTQSKEDESEIEFLDLPYLVTVETRDKTGLYPEIDAYWFLLFPEHKVYRFIYLSDQEKEDKEEIEYAERFRPILLIHGFKSTYSTWNWMAQRLWADGYRNIFAMELFSYTSGFPKLFEQLSKAIDQILSMLENFDFVHIFGHSMGGMVARYYLKQEIDPRVRFCMTLGSPHYGVFNILNPFADMQRGRIKILKTHMSIWEQWFKTREAYSLNHDYVFFTDQGKAGKRSIERYFNKISEMIREKPFKEQLEHERITSHTLRYTFAVKCWRSGMDLLVLSKILGHASLTTTQRYLRVTEEEILEKYEEQASKVL